MARLEIGFFSEVLGMCTSCTVVMPQPKRADMPAKELPVLYLLPWLGGNHTAWTRRTSVERYAERFGICVVMPDIGLSSCADMLHGGRYHTYLAEELPRVMLGYLPISAEPARTFIAGCSIGGFGALRIALRAPERFAAVGSLSSGMVSYRGCVDRLDDRGQSLKQWIWGSEDALCADDAVTVAAAKVIPDSLRVYMCCGTEDNMLLDNCRETRDLMGARVRYEEFPGGHNWTFWDTHITDFLSFALGEA